MKKIMKKITEGERQTETDVCFTSLSKQWKI